jgi:hypothetical protein
MVISTNAVQSAPAGLMTTVSTAGVLAGAAVHNAATLTTTAQAVAMTTIQKTLVAAALVAAVGTGI